MKSSTRIVLARAWWKKEAPQGLKKSGPLFERALDDYARAEAGLGKGNAAAFKAMEKAVADLDRAGKEVAKEARELCRAACDRTAQTDLDNTVLVMSKPFARAIEDLRAAMAAAAPDGLPWLQCLLQITRPDYRLKLSFDYENPDRWSAQETSADMSAFADALRPA